MAAKSLFFFFLFSTLLALCRAQTQCVSPRSHPGHCIPVPQCAPILAILRAPPVSNEDMAFLRQSGCGFHGKLPLVCCEDPTITTSTHKPLTTLKSRRNSEELQPITSTPEPTVDPRCLLDSHPNRHLLPRECGEDFTERIVGGNVTGIDEFPWTALLQYQKGTRLKFMCGGVLINERYVLTAAHCTSRTGLQGHRLVKVRLGEHDTTTDNDCEPHPITWEVICTDPVEDVVIEKVIVHEEYVRGSTNQFHDIALLRLDHAVPLNNNFIKAICIPLDCDIVSKSYEGHNLTVTGWGRTETGSTSDKKLKVSLPVVSNSECKNFFAARRRNVTALQVCAGGVAGKDSCNGDSGGPLMSAETVNRKTHFHVTGIVSYGPSPCGKQGWPGVYTRVSAYSKWILDNLEP